MSCKPAVLGLQRTQKKDLLMHRVSCARIKNFRSCRNVTLPLEGYTPLIGPMGDTEEDAATLQNGLGAEQRGDIDEATAVEVAMKATFAR